MPQPQLNVVLAILALAVAAGVQPALAQSAEATRLAVVKAMHFNPILQARMDAYLGKPQATGHIGAGMTASQLLWYGVDTATDATPVSSDRMRRWFEFVAASEQTALEATRALYEVERQHRLVSLAQENVRQHQATVDALRLSTNTSLDWAGDLIQINARLALAKSNLEAERAKQRDAAAQYTRVVGEAPMPAGGALEALRVGSLVKLNDAAQLAMSQSPLVSAATEQLRAARLGEQDRQGAPRQRVNATTRAGPDQSRAGTERRKADARGGVALNWNRLEVSADRATLQGQRKSVGQAMDSLERACRAVRQTATDAYIDANNLTEQVSTLARTAATVERERAAEQQQFNGGLRSPLAMLMALDKAYTAQRNLTNAVYDRASARSRTLTALNQLSAQLFLVRTSESGGVRNHLNGDDSARCPGQLITAAAPPLGSALERQVQPLPLPLPQPQPQPLSQQRQAIGATRSSTAADVTSLVLAWAGSIEKKDLAGFVSLYAPDYMGNATSINQWQSRQSYLFGRDVPLQVQVEDLRVKVLDDGFVETRFSQVFRAGAGKSATTKLMVWKQVAAGKWRIVREETP